MSKLRNYTRFFTPPRDLYAIFPKNFDKSKKTIVMFGRHHGDEGTANWIIEGFVNHWLADSQFDLQVVLYPMVNPDGAESRSRYNSKRRDLNRSWGSGPERSKDEIKIIHQHLNQFLLNNQNIVVALDMHGSFKKDFIYRVKRAFRGAQFYQNQQKVIDELKAFDSFQNGRFELSNGDRAMARIQLIRGHGINALTHETPRDIQLNNSRGRTLKTLKEQGYAIYRMLLNLYN